MASGEKNDKNPIGFYLIFDKDVNRSTDDFKKMIPGTVYINKMQQKEGADKMLIAALPKSFYDNNTPEVMLDKYNIAIRRFKPKNNDKLKRGTTWGFYITSGADYINFSSSLNNLFIFFEESKLIEKDSYEVIYPKPYPNGTMRKYAIVTFKTNNEGVYPMTYIRKLKILLNNSTYQDINFKVDWLSLNVMHDIKKGNNKEIREKNMVSVNA